MPVEEPVLVPESPPPSSDVPVFDEQAMVDANATKMLPRKHEQIRFTGILRL
jgi:hypothetical protein